MATGPATASIVSAFGYERADLRLGRGSNAGIIRAEEQPAGEDDSLRGFFAATRRGMVETLAYQATERLTDLLHEPARAAADVARIVDAVAPDAVLVDHLAFSARLGLSAARGAPRGRRARASHGAARRRRGLRLPAGVARCVRPGPGRARRAARALRRGRRALHRRVERGPRRDRAERARGRLRVPRPRRDGAAELSEPRSPSPARLDGLRHAFLGSAVREEAADPEVEAWLAAGGGPFVYVSFGSFLSERADVLARVMAALAGLGVRAAIATGSADPAAAAARAGRVARARVPAAGAAARIRCRGGHPRRQQQRHRGRDGRGAAPGPAVLDGPVRGRRRARALRRRGRARAERGHDGRATRRARAGARPGAARGARAGRRRACVRRRERSARSRPSPERPRADA